MKHIYLLLFTCILAPSSFAQLGWTWTALPNMPHRIANNAVVEGSVNGTPYVYSFCGIDSTKSPAGINLNAYRYNFSTQLWEQIPDVPDTMGKIAAGASVVNNIIYVMGGYHVTGSFNEFSSDRVHRYDPETNSWMSDGAPIPVATDDHIQAVWRDSLIFVVTGWSNTANIPDVQIYDPANDSWQVGTPVPNNNNYKSFGASGVIIGDTIYYNGGAAMGFNFPGRRHLRRGIINPADPTQITWDMLTDNPGNAGYRMAATNYNNHIFWIGGSPTTYNFDGIAYNGSGGVDPMARILAFDTETHTWNEGTGQPQQQMDLRGAAKMSANTYVICGGMEISQQVSKRTWLLEFDPATLSTPEIEEAAQLQLWPNPAAGQINILAPFAGRLMVFDNAGKQVYSEDLNSPATIQLDLPKGIFHVELTGNQQRMSGTFVIGQ